MQPGPTSASFEPAKTGPEFFSREAGAVGVQLSNFPARLTGRVIINMRAWQAAHHLGRANAFRADQGQPITIGSIAKTGLHVTINSPLGGTLTIGKGFRTGSNVVVLSGPKVNAVIGDDVKINSGAVVVQTSIGSNSTVGKGAYLANSTFPAHTVIPPKAIYVNNKFLGYVRGKHRDAGSDRNRPFGRHLERSADPGRFGAKSFNVTQKKSWNRSQKRSATESNFPVPMTTWFPKPECCQSSMILV